MFLRQAGLWHLAGAVLCVFLLVDAVLQYSGVVFTGQEDTKQAAPKPRRWGKSRPYFGTIVASEGLCDIASKDDKDTIRVEIDLGDSGLSYLPGDALGILPLNCYKASCSLSLNPT